MTIEDKTTLTTDITTDIPDNNTALVTPADIRTNMIDIVDSMLSITSAPAGGKLVETVGTVGETVESALVVANIVETTDIDTLAEINAIITDATLIDTTDSRLSDARTPLAHASTHSDGGTDEITVENLATASTNTDHVLKPDGAGGLVFGTSPATGGLVTKSGVIAPAGFPAGSPRKATVTFSTAFADANYSMTVMSEDSRSFTVESVVAGSFVINSNSASAISGNTYWTAIKHGES